MNAKLKEIFLRLFQKQRSLLKPYKLSQDHCQPIKPYARCLMTPTVHLKTKKALIKDPTCAISVGGTVNFSLVNQTRPDEESGGPNSRKWLKEQATG